MTTPPIVSVVIWHERNGIFRSGILGVYADRASAEREAATWNAKPDNTFYETTDWPVMPADSGGEPIRWPVTIGSKWTSRTLPGTVWTLTMAESPTQIIRLNHEHFAWEGTVLLAQGEFWAVP